mmetsp:Transcript_57412/g.101882  ORF Transcript_57412/g.101882 Transcript_57412/m.101882 type:complete len:230 (+) Transcript_57412:3153-3842(+)
MLRHSFELGPENFVLCCDANRAGVQVTLTHHDAAHGNERSCGKAEMLGTEKGSHNHITASAELAICFQGNSTTKPIENQSLVSLCEAELPWCTGALDSRPLGSSCASVAATDEDVIGLALCHTCSYDANTKLADKFHADIGLGVCTLQVMDELCKILDGVDVVVRRWRNQADSRSAVPALSDVWFHFPAWQLTSFSWLCTLRHFDLNLFGIREVFDGHTEAPGGNLLDG